MEAFVEGILLFLKFHGIFFLQLRPLRLHLLQALLRSFIFSLRGVTAALHLLGEFGIRPLESLFFHLHLTCVFLAFGFQTALGLFAHFKAGHQAVHIHIGNLRLACGCSLRVGHTVFLWGYRLVAITAAAEKGKGG